MSEIVAYAELAVTSNFSFLRGASHPDELVAAAKARDLCAVGIADRNTLAGVVRAHSAARQMGMRLLVGTRLVLRDGFEMACYPCDLEAYGRLSQLLTRGNGRAPKGECYLDWEDLSTAATGQVFIALPPDHVEPGEVEEHRFAAGLARLARLAPGACYIGLSLLYRGADRCRLMAIEALAERLAVPTVVTNDVHYHDADRRSLQDVLTAIRLGTTVAEAGRSLFANAERHMKTGAEMARLFAGRQEAVARTLEIMERCQFSLDDLSYQYPEEIEEPNYTPQETLERHVWAGAQQRYPDGVPDDFRQTILAELDLIQERNYAPYFLTVNDLIVFARDKGILCQGRGSAANSAVCYCLGVTSINPLQMNLLFERFISAQRNEPPDIDVDFEHTRREEVIQYVYEKYGRDRAGIAATVITYRAKSAIRDVGKALGLSLDMVGALSRTIWGWSAEGVDPKHLRENGLDPDDPLLACALNLSRMLIGFPRHLSQHVGGFVITRDRLDAVVPIANAAMPDRTFVEWDKDDLDALGILKVDVLALGMLTALRKGLDMLSQSYGVDHVNGIASIPTEDGAVYDMICRADTIGVFQVESRAQMSMLPRLKPRSFYDLVVEVAIVRPGPIQGDMVHPYLRRRMGEEEVFFPSQDLKSVLGKTLGVPLFQEQAMRIAIVAAGFEPTEADQLRRAMATFRKSGLIHNFGMRLVEGMVANGYERDFAERCFRQIEGFGEYGFPESHAASFALLVYASAWLKCHYPDVFLCALLNAQPLGFYAPAQLVRDAREHGVIVRPADINASHWDTRLEPLDAPYAMDATKQAIRTREGGNRFAVRLGLRDVKGVPQAAADHLVAVREALPGGFDSIRALWAATGLDTEVLEALAHGDGFGSLGHSRREALWAVRALAPEPLPLFRQAADLDREPEVALPSMPLGEEVVHDYRSLHLSLKSHPVWFLRRDLTAYGAVPASAVQGRAAQTKVTVAGLVLVRQRPGSAKGVIFVTLEDETGVVNVVVWPKVFETFRRLVLASRIMLVRGRVEREKSVVHVVADEIIDLSSMLSTLYAEPNDLDSALAPADEVRHGGEDPRVTSQAKRRQAEERVRAIVPASRDFH